MRCTHTFKNSRWSVEVALDFGQVLFAFNWYIHGPAVLSTMDVMWNVFFGPLRVGGWRVK